MHTEIMSVLNFKSVSESNLSIPVDQIPTLTPPKLLDRFISNDKDPFFKYEEIKYPLVANGLTYQESFFTSYIKKASEKLIPGQKYGHAGIFGSRSKSDFFMIGGLTVSNGDGTGKAFLKNYIPKKADSDNEFFIKELESGLAEFSLVSNARIEIIETSDSIIRTVIESVSGERNDAVGKDEGAMAQILTSKNIQNDTGEDMPKDEILKTTINLLKNGQITLADIATPANMQDQIVTTVHNSAIETIDKIKQLTNSENVVEWVENSIKREAENAEEFRNALLTKEFGVVKNAEGVDNKSRLMAETLAGKDVLTEELISNIKKNPLYLAIRGQEADINSDINILGVSNFRKEVVSEPKKKSTVIEY